VKATGLHKHTIQARLREGSLRGKKIGREWRIYKDSLPMDIGTRKL
jgi:excisionase family DNA binding protein